jgi:hypothetical protein
MRTLLLSSLFLFSSLSFASDPKSDQMVELLLRSGVDSFGKKESLDAEVGCKKTEKKDLFCFVSSFTGHDIPTVHYVEYRGAEAQEISMLLKDFDIMPYGKKLSQAGSIRCHVPKDSSDGKRSCEVLKVDVIIDGV